MAIFRSVLMINISFFDTAYIIANHVNLGYNKFNNNNDYRFQNPLPPLSERRHCGAQHGTKPSNLPNNSSEKNKQNAGKTSHRKMRLKGLVGCGNL